MVLTSSVVGAADLPSAIASLSRARCSGVAKPLVAEYESLIVSCIEHGRPTYAYRLMEEGAADGLRLHDLSASTRSLLEGRVPPEAEMYHSTSGAPTNSASRDNRRLIVDPLPDLWVKPRSQVETFDCSGSPGNADGLLAAWSAVERQDRPVLFRGVGSHWPALDTWSLDMLGASLQRGMVRVSPTPRVTFCRESHPDVRAGLLEPPSRTVLMDIGEFIDRVHVDRGGRAPLIFGDTERCYLQALAPYKMMEALDFSFLSDSPEPPMPPSEGQAGEGGGEDDSDAGDSNGSAPSVLGRLWVSAPGTVSPLHYDNTDSYLCQVGGVKRLLLWPKASLRALDPYPTDHPLARRLRVDVTGAAPSKRLKRPWRTLARRTVGRTALEAVLRPGDVLYFPEGWAHHTEAAVPADGCAAEPSFSLGFRTDGRYLL